MSNFSFSSAISNGLENELKWYFCLISNIYIGYYFEWFYVLLEILFLSKKSKFRAENKRSMNWWKGNLWRRWNTRASVACALLLNFAIILLSTVENRVKKNVSLKIVRWQIYFFLPIFHIDTQESLLFQIVVDVDFVFHAAPHHVDKPAKLGTMQFYLIDV